MIRIAGQETFYPLRFSDAACLRQSGLRLPLHAAEGDPLRHFLQDLRLSCNRQAWLVVRSANPDQAGQASYAAKDVLALYGLQDLDQHGRRARLRLYCRPEGPDRQLLDSIANHAMNQQQVFRLEMDIGRQELHWQAAFCQSGWRQEGQLHLAQYDDKTAIHHDVLLYAYLRPQQTAVSVAFVPFNKAVLALVASQTGLTRSCFVRYGERSADQRIQESAAWFHLLDSQGRLPDRPSLQARLGGRSWLALPEAPIVLTEAAEQAVQYFQGKRRRFDVAMHLEQGSVFQQKVWQALLDIPYALTRTYEDIALAIHQENETEARRMARAVGAACSANPLPLMVPCHRVIGKDGRLVGFSSGLDIKEYLLAHEFMGLG